MNSTGRNFAIDLIRDNNFLSGDTVISLTTATPVSAGSYSFLLPAAAGDPSNRDFYFRVRDTTIPFEMTGPRFKIPGKAQLRTWMRAFACMYVCLCLCVHMSCGSGEVRV